MATSKNLWLWPVNTEKCSVFRSWSMYCVKSVKYNCSHNKMSINLLRIAPVETFENHDNTPRHLDTQPWLEIPSPYRSLQMHLGKYAQCSNAGNLFSLSRSPSNTLVNNPQVPAGDLTQYKSYVARDAPNQSAVKRRRRCAPIVIRRSRSSGQDNDVCTTYSIVVAHRAGCGANRSRIKYRIYTYRRWR